MVIPAQPAIRVHKEIRESPAFRDLAVNPDQ